MRGKGEGGAGVEAAMGSLDAWVAHMMQRHAHQSALLREGIAITPDMAAEAVIQNAGEYLGAFARTSTEKTAKKESLASAAAVSDQLVESVNQGVQQAFINEKQIEMEARALGITVQNFVKQTSQWFTVVHTFDTALKEIGDFENWIKTMEYDCEKIAGTLRTIASTREPTTPS